jgi:hypothetical protein
MNITTFSQMHSEEKIISKLVEKFGHDSIFECFGTFEPNGNKFLNIVLLQGAFVFEITRRGRVIDHSAY